MASVWVATTFFLLVYNAFLNAKGLTNITLPYNIESIGLDAFSGCDGLTDIYYSGTKEQWEQIPVEKGNDSFYAVTIHCSDGDIVPEDGGNTYEIIIHLGTLDPETGYYAMSFDETGTTVISVPSDELMDLYLDDEKLVHDSGYTLDLGSTASLSITIPHHVTSVSTQLPPSSERVDRPTGFCVECRRILPSDLRTLSFYRTDMWASPIPTR